MTMSSLSSLLLGRNTSRRTSLLQFHFLSYSNKRCLTSSSDSDNKSRTTTSGSSEADNTGDGGESSNSRTSSRSNNNSNNSRKKKTGRSAIPQVEQRFKKLKQKEYGRHIIFPFSSTSGDGDGDGDGNGNGFQSNFIKPSQFLYSYVPDPATLPSPSTSAGGKAGGGGSSLERHVLYSMDASPFLDPSRYCKQATGTAQPYRDASRSIDGTSAARRLLYGKKNLTNCLVDWMSPELPTNGNSRHRQMIIPRQYLRLEGHGCHPGLFQHCINIGYAFLQYYGDHTESCSFHNFYNFDNHNQGDRRDSSSRSSSVFLDQQQQQDAYPEDLALYRRLIPQQVVTRANSGSIVACVKPPKAADSDAWENRMALYLTAMERLVRELGGIMDKSIGRSQHYSHANTTTNADTDRGKDNVKRRNSKAQHSTPPPIQDYDYDQDDAEPSSSSHLFPSSICWEDPRWSVDILRRKDLMLHPLHDDVRAIREGDTFRKFDDENPDPPPPFPIIEFIPPMTEHNQQSSMSPTTTSRRVSIRIQGYAMPNGEFWDTDLDRRPQSERFVSLVLNASPSPTFRLDDQHSEI